MNINTRQIKDDFKTYKCTSSKHTSFRNKAGKCRQQKCLGITYFKHILQNVRLKFTTYMNNATFRLVV